MEKEFVNYEQALVLKELGFDEECFGWYDSLDKNLWLNTESKQTLLFHKSLSRFSGSILAPLKQQVFRWFREKYRLDSYVRHEAPDVEAYYELVINEDVIDFIYDNHPEAENACIDKLIEIAKQQDHE